MCVYGGGGGGGGGGGHLVCFIIMNCVRKLICDLPLHGCQFKFRVFAIPTQFA